MVPSRPSTLTESHRYAGDFMPVAGNIKSHLSTFYVDRLIISTGCFFLSPAAEPVSQFSSPRPPTGGGLRRHDLETPARNTVTSPHVSRHEIMIVGDRAAVHAQFINIYKTISHLLLLNSRLTSPSFRRTILDENENGVVSKN